MNFILKGYISVFVALFYFINSVSAQTDLMVPDEKNAQIKVNNLSNQSYNIRVALDHVFISNKNNSLEISEIVVFRNEGQEIYYSKDNHTFFAISTPPDTKDLKTQAMECCLVQEEGIVYMDPMRSVKPGDNFDMKISYVLIPLGQDYVFNKSAVYNTTALSIFVDKKSGMSLEGPYNAITLSGIEYNVITFNDIRPGDTVSIPVKIMRGPDYLYAGIGLFFLFLMGSAYLFRGKLKRMKTKDLPLEELELEKRKIFQTIYGFEKHAGPEKSEEYTKLMEEYRNKAIQISFKIDNLKCKVQKNHR